MSNRDSLVKLYAKTPLNEVLTSAAYQELYASHGSDSGFGGERNAVEKAKQWVDQYLLIGLTEREQLQKAIALLIATRRNVHQTVCYELIVGGYKAGWTQAQQAYFEFAWKRIQAKFDFFFSFTTRNPVKPGENPINRKYRWFISHVLGPDDFQKADRKEANLLAEAIHRQLLTNNSDLVSFYFPESQYDNSVTLAKLEAALSDHLVFVQLVQGIMFEKYGEEDNYCFKEYNLAVEALKGDCHKDSRVIFVLAGQNREAFRNKLVLPDYLDWQKHICEKDPPYLGEVEFEDQIAVKKLKELIDEKISPHISKVLYRLIDEAP
jgi:hypothetical protein